MVTLAGFAATSVAGVNPAWAAAAGAAVLGDAGAGPAAHHTAEIWRAADVPFLPFVVALGVVVAAVTGTGWPAPVSGDA